MSLADVVATLRSSDNRSVGHRLFDHLRSRKQKLIYPMKPGDCFRISRLYKVCAREEVLATREEIIRLEWTHPGLQITFDIGNSFHELYRNKYLGPMGEWAGAWECKRCGWDTDIEGLSEPPVKGKRLAKLARMPESCPKCGAVRPELCPECGEMRGVVCDGCGAVRDGMDPEQHIRSDGIIVFKEWSIRDEKMYLKGHPDGWKWLAGSRPNIGDLKSHGANGFNGRNTVRKGHDWQVWAYQWCANEMDRVGEVIYLNKSPWGDHSSFVRSIEVPFDPKLFDKHVRRPMMEIQEGLNGGKLPGKICSSPESSRAKECQLREVCFYGN